LEKTDGKERISNINQLVLTFMGQNALPFSLSNSSSFRKLLNELEPRYKVPSTWAFSSKLAPERVGQYNDSLRCEINAAEDFSMTIEFDRWSSNSGMSVLAVVLTRPSGRSSLLDLLDTSSESHTGEFLASAAIGSLESVNFDLKKINVIVSDEASYCKLARSLIIEERDFEHVFEYR